MRVIHDIGNLNQNSAIVCLIFVDILFDIPNSRGTVRILAISFHHRFNEVGTF